MLDQSKLFFEDMIEFHKRNIFQKRWVTVYERMSLENREERSIYCALVRKDKAAQQSVKSDWDLTKPGHPASEVYHWEDGELKHGYESYTHGSEVQPLIFIRDIPEKKMHYPEICEEFRIRFNLFQDTDRHFYRYDQRTGEKDKVVDYRDDRVQILYKYLWEFIGVKQVCLAVFSEVWRYPDNAVTISRDEYVLEDQGETLIIDRWMPDDFPGQISFVMFRGKSYLFPIEEERISTLTEPVKNYESYIIGRDQLGNNIEFTSNPDELKNYFGANPDAPHYLTPVFFDKAVLKKYFDDHDKYEIDDGVIRCRYWSLRMDNNRSDFVNVFLGDLGRILPNSEQKYWKSFNIYVEHGRISSTKFRRAILGEFVDSDEPALLLRQSLSAFQKAWRDKFNWDLILPMQAGDDYVCKSLRIPLNETQKEFDEVILLTAKTFNDSINIKELKKHISESESADSEENKKPIELLEKFLNEKSFHESTKFCSLLRDIQSVRSSGSAHRKGKSYDKAVKRICPDDQGYIQSLEHLYRKLASYLEEIRVHFQLDED